MNRPKLASILKERLTEQCGIAKKHIIENYPVQVSNIRCCVDLAIMDSDKAPLLFVLIVDDRPVPRAKMQSILDATDFQFGFAFYYHNEVLQKVVGLEKDVLADFLVCYREVTDMISTTGWWVYMEQVWSNYK